jgi:hypothetical protein
MNSWLNGQTSEQKKTGFEAKCNLAHRFGGAACRSALHRDEDFKRTRNNGRRSRRQRMTVVGRSGDLDRIEILNSLASVPVAERFDCVKLGIG